MPQRAWQSPQQRCTRFAIWVLLAVAQTAIPEPASAYTLKTLYSFCSKADCADGSAPSARLFMDPAGNVFGTTYYGGIADGFRGSGVAFELKRARRDRWAYKVIHLFCSETACGDGQHPSGTLLSDANGNLYGTTELGGGLDSAGTAFELLPSAENGKWIYRLLHGFSDSDGTGLIAGLTYAGATSGLPYDGTSPLYGVACCGGAHGEGTAFQLTLSADAWTVTVLHDFGSTESDGAEPQGALTVDPFGSLYGTTINGGAYQRGTAFKLAQVSGVWVENVLHSFCQLDYCKDGGWASGALLPDAKWNLLGTTAIGGSRCHGRRRLHCKGVIYDLSNDGAGYSLVHSFCREVDCEDGGGSLGGLVMEGARNLYGTTLNGGVAGGGTAFEVRNGRYEVIYNFCSLANCMDGSAPFSSVIVDSRGNLFGTTSTGGTYNGGSIFELTP